MVVTAGLQTATKDASGYFRITGAALYQNASVISAEFPGYFKAYPSFMAISRVTQIVIQLVKKSLWEKVDAASGGSVYSDTRGIRSFGGGRIMLTDRSTYSGTVNLYAAYIDPASARTGQEVPGSFMGDDNNNVRVALTSYLLRNASREPAIPFGRKTPGSS